MIADFTVKHNNGLGDKFAVLNTGSYNITLRLQHGKRSKVIRFCQPGAIFFPEEKVINDVGLMGCLLHHTSIPIPRVLVGKKEESPLELSLFIMMDYIDHHALMHNILNIPGCPADSRGYLNPNIDQTRLEALYGELASVLLKLSVPSLPRIRSLTQINDFTWEVSRRPLSMNMNDLKGRGALPRSALPDVNTMFDTTSSYLEALAELNVKHLIDQRNDAISSGDDCRRKVVLRKLFLKLAKEKKLNDPNFENGLLRSAAMTCVRLMSL